MNPIQINLNNLRDNNVYLLLTVNNTTASTANVTGITVNTPTSITAITNNTIYASNINGGRLYFCDGPIGSTPIGPHTDYYYAWIEFSQMPSDCVKGSGVCQYWVNLSNVDITGMQLALSGTDINGEVFSVGYKESANDLIKRLGKAFPNAIRKCANSKKKIIAPNNRPNAYSSFSDYLNSLIATKSGMIITSDGIQTQFTGKFCNYFDASVGPTGSTVVVKLVDVNENTFKITKESLTTNIIYQCDGGHIYYNNVQYPQNRSGSTANEIVTNSVFREIMLGLNEGYFISGGTINNCDFPTLVPFTNGGNNYADIIHGFSNSYGFPYADSNLKVLLTATASTQTPLTITVCNDKTPMGYTDAKSTNNAPKCGSNSMGIGPNSELGKIIVGQCTYSQMVNNTYSGILPDCPQWTKMYFSGDTYIWLTTSGSGNVIAVDASGNTILTGAAPQWNKIAGGDKCLSWGADVTINPLAGPCINPPTPPNPPTGFWKWLQEMWFLLLLWNKWTK